ncbi:hypothetical protein [Elizabethkingia meningoseptica]|uniref:hypothetical protein n=1 Tax=Elizabethkingia meningoseptica TaxID=238 RepID=UPI0023AF3314|nr:hypothetical protein [Elizabethkingia meningoseptica]
MNKLTPYLFSVICALLIFQKTWIWAEYKINMDWYIENCINKNKPEMHCNGKCQLSSEEDKNPNFTWLKIATEFVGLPVVLTKVVTNTISHVRLIASHNIQHLLLGYLSLHLRPPVL